MICPACGVSQDDERFYCRSCNWLLFAVPDDENPPPDGDERVIALSQACEKVGSGRWNVSQFQSFLASFTMEQKRRGDEIKGLPIPSELEEDFAEEQELAFEGIDFCNRGLNTLFTYDPACPDREILSQGLRDFWKGVNLVKEAMTVNRRNAARPVWF